MMRTLIFLFCKARAMGEGGDVEADDFEAVQLSARKTKKLLDKRQKIKIYFSVVKPMANKGFYGKFLNPTKVHLEVLLSALKSFSFFVSTSRSSLCVIAAMNWRTYSATASRVAPLG